MTSPIPTGSWCMLCMCINHVYACDVCYKDLSQRAKYLKMTPRARRIFLFELGEVTTEHNPRNTQYTHELFSARYWVLSYSVILRCWDVEMLRYSDIQMFRCSDIQPSSIVELVYVYEHVSVRVCVWVYEYECMCIRVCVWVYE